MQSIQPSQPPQGPLGPGQPYGPMAFAAGQVVEESGPGGFADAIRILKQRKLMIVIVFLLLYALVGGATLVVRVFFPAFTSESFLELLPTKKGFEQATNEDLWPDIQRQALETESRKIKQLSLMLEVIKQPEVRRTEFVQYYGGDVTKCAFELQRYLVVAPVPGSKLIRVALSIRDRKDAETIVRATVEQYLTRYSSSSRDEMTNQVEALKKMLASKEDELKRLRDSIANFRDVSTAVGLETDRNLGSEYVDELYRQLTLLEMNATQTDAQLQQLQGMPRDQIPITAQMRLVMEADPMLRYWRSQAESVDVEIQASATRYGKNHPSRTLIEQRREGFLQLESARREELIAELREREVEALRQDSAAIRSMLARINEQLGDALADQRELDRAKQKYRQMLEDQDLLIKQIETLRKEATEKEYLLDDPERVRLRLIQAATEAIKPTRPNLPLFLGGGFLLALLGAVGLAFLREFTDTRLRTPIDVARSAHLSVLGSIPLIDYEQAELDAIEQATRAAPNSLVAEAFRQLRANVLFSGPAEHRRTFLVTGPGPEDGKTAVAINLAVTLAQSGLRVLLVDCNFRRPAIINAFPNTRADGLSNILIGQGKLDDYVTGSGVPNLDVLTSGRMPPTPAELLGSDAMQKLIAEARTRYDHVIFDGPPALVISDAMVLAKQVDGVLLVARAVTNTRGQLKRAKEQLERIGARVIGAVLNGVQTRAGGYYRQAFREFYEYGGDETIPPELPGPDDRRS